MSLRKAGDRTLERTWQNYGLGLKELVGVVPGISGGGASDGRDFLRGRVWNEAAPGSSCFLC